jgi:hypothetical protein
MLKYAYQRKATWNYFTSEWVLETFGGSVDIPATFPDILVTVIK